MTVDEEETTGVLPSGDDESTPYGCAEERPSVLPPPPGADEGERMVGPARGRLEIAAKYDGSFAASRRVRLNPDGSGTIEADDGTELERFTTETIERAVARRERSRDFERFLPPTTPEEAMAMAAPRESLADLEMPAGFSFDRAPSGVVRDLPQSRAFSGPWFLTLTGRQYFYDDPSGYPFDIEEIAAVLARVPRYASHLTVHYGVGQHSTEVAGEVYRRATIELGLPLSEVMPLCRAALLHDASEFVLLDVPRPLKRIVELAGYRVLEDRTQRAILRHFGLEAYHEHPEIKRADAAALRTEKRDLRPPSSFDPVDERGHFLTVPIVPLPVDTARVEFLRLWRVYGGE